MSIFLKNQSLTLTEKGWWVAAFLFFFSHLYDVLIYDIRINIASWIFLVGLRNTFKNNKKLPYILSGGLNVTNIKKAINLTGADFVDINSGVEEQPGEKSLTLIDGIISSIYN